MASKSYVTCIVYGVVQLPACIFGAGRWLPSHSSLFVGVAMALHGICVLLNQKVDLGDAAMRVLPWLGATLALVLGDMLALVSAPLLSSRALSPSLLCPQDDDGDSSLYSTLIQPPVATDALLPASWSTVRDGHHTE